MRRKVRALGIALCWAFLAWGCSGGPPPEEPVNGEEEETADATENANMQDVGNASEGNAAPEESSNHAAEPVAPPPAMPVEQSVKADVVRGLAGNPIGSGLPELGSKMSYVVKKGDTLSRISKKIFGDLKKWKNIAEFSGLDNPNMIFPGDIVYYQLDQNSLSFAKVYENQPVKEYKVAQGDSLTKIAQKAYGHADKWKILWRQNAEIKNPNELKIGMTIYITESFVKAVQEEKVKSEKFVFAVKKGKKIA